MTDVCHKSSQLPRLSNDRIEALLNYVCKGTANFFGTQIFPRKTAHFSAPLFRKVISIVMSLLSCTEIG